MSHACRSEQLSGDIVLDPFSAPFSAYVRTDARCQLLLLLPNRRTMMMSRAKSDVCTALGRTVKKVRLMQAKQKWHAKTLTSPDSDLTSCVKGITTQMQDEQVVQVDPSGCNIRPSARTKVRGHNTHSKERCIAGCKRSQLEHAWPRGQTTCTSVKDHQSLIGTGVTGSVSMDQQSA